jgi:hypothetical protein
MAKKSSGGGNKGGKGGKGSVKQPFAGGGTPTRRPPRQPGR